MEIQKIFSEIDTDEKLYSVLMTEEELALFSEAIEDENNTATKIDRVSKTVGKVGLGVAGAGAGALALGSGLAYSGGRAAGKSIGKMAQGAEGVAIKGGKRILGGAALAGLGGKALKYGGLATLGAGAVYGINKLANGNSIKKKE